MKVSKIVLLILLTSVVIYSCKKSDQYSDVPSITFKSLTVKKAPGSVYDSIAILVISFTDGDGDIGSTQYSGVAPDIFISFFQKTNGVWSADTTLGENLPNLTPTGNNKALKGDIEHTMLVPFAASNDTLRYEVYITDRANHKSNVVTTPEIVVTNN